MGLVRMQKSFGSEWNTCKDLKRCGRRVGHRVKGQREFKEWDCGREVCAVVDGADLRNHGRLHGLEARGNATIPRIVKTQSSFSDYPIGRVQTLITFPSSFQVSRLATGSFTLSSVLH